MPKLLGGVVQYYDWGDKRTIPELLGVEPDSRPWAELWFGTHQRGPSTFQIDGSTRELSSFTGDLSFLVKVIAAATPLSLQTHPTTEQALVGFDRENASGMTPTDPDRIYPDSSAKPEFICAISSFEALCGFQTVEESLRNCEQHDWGELADHLLQDGLAQSVRWALSTTDHVLPENIPDWAQRLATLYPGSGGVVVALLMNHVHLSPGEALFLDAGNVHAYLHGTAVEVMSSSDNVVRAAFTKKHVDVNEFLEIANLSPTPPSNCHPTLIDTGCWQYAIPTDAFGVQRIEVADKYLVTATHDTEILLCIDGHAGFLSSGQAGVLRMGEALQLSGPSKLFRTWGPE